MKINRQIILRVCCGVSLVGLLTGCAMLPKNKVAKSTTNYNLVVEQTGNEMLLLNIVRASKRHPMYFTGLSGLRGKVLYEVSTGNVTIPFGKIGTGFSGAYTAVSPNLSYQSSPEFDVGVLDNKEFYNAMMTTVPIETIYYFWQQGWPKEMLLHLFIRRIDHTKNGELVEGEDPYCNYPGNQDEFRVFQAKLREIFSKCTIVANETSESIGDKINAKDAKDLKDLIDVSKAGLELKQIKGEKAYQLRSHNIEYKFKCRDEDKIEMKVISAQPEDSHPSKEKGKDVYIIYLRSPEAMLYYLGEIARAEILSQDKGIDWKPMIITDPKHCGSEPAASLFVVHKKTYEDKANFVTVTYEGTKYVIPRCPEAESDDECKVDRSMHVLSLISLIIGKQKTYGTSPAPTTGVVTGIVP